MRLAVLDQSPIVRGETAAQALANTVKLARETERLGYHRYWLAGASRVAKLRGLPRPKS